MRGKTLKDNTFVGSMKQDIWSSLSKTYGQFYKKHHDLNITEPIIKQTTYINPQG